MKLNFGFSLPLRAHLDLVPLNYPSETVVQPSSTAHFHYGFPTFEPLSWYSNKLLSSNLINRYFSALQEMPHPLKRMFLKTFLPHWCKTLETYFSWIIFHGDGGVGASGGGCVGETARLHHQLFVRRGDIHPCALFGLPLGLWTLFSEQQLHASLHVTVRSLFPHGLH